MRTSAVIAVLLLVGCTGRERVANAPQAGDTIQLPPVEWRVVDAHALLQVYRNSGLEVPQHNQLEGFVGVDSDGRPVIYTLPPRTVDDQVTCTVGHEVMHVALGNYHRERK